MRKGRLKCQACGRVRHEEIPETADVLTCEACGWFGELSDWWKGAPEDEAAVVTAAAPVDTGIRIEEQGGQSVFHIPASGSGGGLVVFGWLWTGFCSLFLMVALFADGPPEFLPLVMAAGFVGIGVAMLYFGYRMKNARHRVVIGADRIEMTREWRGRRKTKVMPRREFEDVRRQVFYTRNYEPVYGIEFRGRSGKLRFGSGLRADEKVWLVSEFRSRLLPDSGERDAGKGAPGDRGKEFTIEVPANSSVIGLWLVLMGMGLVFGGIAIFAMGDEGGASDAPFPFSLIEGLFGFLGSFMRVVFGLVGLVMLGGGLAGLVHALKRRNTKRELVGTRGKLKVVDRRQGFVVRERLYERNAFREFRIRNSGHVNNRPQVKLRMFIGDEVEVLASWVDEQKATDFVERVEAQLGQPQISVVGGVDQGGGGR